VERTYKRVDLPMGQLGYAIHEIFPGSEPGVDRVGDCVLHMLASTMPETVHDTVVALQKAYQQGRADMTEDLSRIAGPARGPDELIRDHLILRHGFLPDELEGSSYHDLSMIHNDQDHPHVHDEEQP
jgi:hypothetical protein